MINSPQQQPYLYLRLEYLLEGAAENSLLGHGVFPRNRIGTTTTRESPILHGDDDRYARFGSCNIYERPVVFVRDQPSEKSCDPVILRLPINHRCWPVPTVDAGDASHSSTPSPFSQSPSAEYRGPTNGNPWSGSRDS